ncbi:MAG: glutamate-5-semialdehyde dehydrogenase [Clostridia bacterium]|nr:glutamate-5-semialdehyde dehydrogenase [Clostridia bacterium]
MIRTTQEILTAAKAASREAALLTESRKNEALLLMADALERGAAEILQANLADLENAKGVLPEVMLDRLRLDENRISAMAKGIREVAALPDPVGAVLERNALKNGLSVSKIRVPLGVIGIIYESRPNVTSDAAALCFKSGNVCILRGGKDAYHSSAAIVRLLRGALKAAGVNENFVNLPDDTSRRSANELMTAVGYVDALIPRGGAGLIRSCVENAKVPCIQTGTGICHVYVDKDADFSKALDIIDNAKTSRPSVCNAEEVCLVHEAVAEKFLPLLKARLVDSRIAAGLVPVELRTDGNAYALIGGTKAGENDFDTEFLDYILAVKVVSDADEAIAHIARHSTGHSDCIVTRNTETADKFALAVDSAAVYINASTRFTDGGEFGKGCEIGISTQKLHARGPMGLEELTSYKYVIRGNGQIRK